MYSEICIPQAFVWHYGSGKPYFKAIGVSVQGSCGAMPGFESPVGEGGGCGLTYKVTYHR